MKLTINIKMDNAAFEDGDEAARLLHEVTEHVRNGDLGGTIYDINGNKVGQYRIR